MQRPLPGQVAVQSHPATGGIAERRGDGIAQPVPVEQRHDPANHHGKHGKAAEQPLPPRRPGRRLWRFPVHFLNIPRGSNAAMAASRISRSEEHTSELQSLMRISYAVFCLKKKKNYTI